MQAFDAPAATDNNMKNKQKVATPIHLDEADNMVYQSSEQTCMSNLESIVYASVFLIHVDDYGHNTPCQKPCTTMKQFEH